MFRAILYTQWKWSRLALVPAALVGFAIPLLSVQGAGEPGMSRWEVRWLLDAVHQWGVAYPVLAAAIGLLVATLAWGADHRGKHVYALSLPIPRWHYLVLRFGAGLVLLAPTVATVWLGGLLATASITIPLGLHAYPTALAFRFALAAVLAYAVFFSISAATTRTAGYILTAVAALFVAQLLANTAGLDVKTVEGLLHRLAIWPGPLEIFTGRWMIIDV